MDLRKFNLTAEQIHEASSVLNYQPFVISDDLQTGVAYSWLYDDDGGRKTYALNEFVFNKNVDNLDVWKKSQDANSKLRTMYDEFLDVISERFPGCSLADMACNNGYFPIGAGLRGMKNCTGFDHADYSNSVNFLNKICGTNVNFIKTHYDSWSHSADGFEPHDVVVASQVMQHISDPLYFLSFVASRAKKALFLFTGMGDTEEYQVYYKDPNKFYKDTKFPVSFDNDVGLSKGLLYKSLDLLGFDEIVEIEWKKEWLPKSWYGSQRALLCIRKSNPYFSYHKFA
jgi:hypothetical protein